ncbi:formyltetrahydrofolate deformylase [Nocardioides sp. YJ-D4]
MAGPKTSSKVDMADPRAIEAETFVLTFACDDEPGIVSAVSTRLFELGCTIVDAQQFDDHLTARFFARIEFRPTRARVSEDEIKTSLLSVMTPLRATWEVRCTSRKMRVLIMASKQDHCLVDLLYRWRTGDLPVDVVAVVSNHPSSVYARVDLSDVPFVHLPVTKETKAEQEAQILSLVDELDVELVVLARYMQILSDDLANKLAGRCINIHHSFLPGFKGAKPYHQAHERGVKLIGATAHYVTGDLDEGPILVQDVEPVSHRDTAEAMVRKGRDIERRVLARAVADHSAGRVLLNGRTTVVFSS